MCYMKCKAGELQATSLQYSFETTIFTLKNQSELYAKVLLSNGISCTQMFNIKCILHVWCLLKDREMLCLEGTKKYVYLNI
jgi:hypothetical protein